VAAGTKFNQIILYKRFMPVFQQIKCEQASPQVCVFTVASLQTPHSISLARMSSGTHFMIRLRQTIQQYRPWRAASVIWACRTENGLVELQC